MCIINLSHYDEYSSVQIDSSIPQMGYGLPMNAVATYDWKMSECPLAIWKILLSFTPPISQLASVEKLL